MNWDFVLKFRLPAGGDDPVSWLDALFEAGCDDATVGVGKPGTIALDFTRVAATPVEAIQSAIRNVQAAIPGAELIEVGPDLVSLTDVALTLGCTKQNIQKYAAGIMRSVTSPFPAPVHSGASSLWRMAEVLGWFDRHTDLHPEPGHVQVALAASRMNLDHQARRLADLATAP